MRKKLGISLVEIVVAVTIFAVASIPIWGVLGSSHKQVVRSVDEIKISQIAIEILEQLENCKRIELPDNKKFSLASGKTISLGENSPVNINICPFDDYLVPELCIKSTPQKNVSGDIDIGTMVEIAIYYKSKEKHNLHYTLRGFISAY